MSPGRINPVNELAALGEAPGFQVDTSLDFQNELAPRLLDRWQSRRSNGGLPARRDFDVLELKDFMGWLCVAEVAPGGDDLVYRLIGTRIVEKVGRDNTGKPVSETLPPAALEIFQHLMQKPQPVRTWGRVAWRDRDFRHHESLVLPLADDGRTVDRFFVLMTFY
ncbi:MAG: PAS domain-containing protein [Minwuia sp.]|uniref:PAS domain-containing protein n=1 Tax=Minwuia sp. TaxID=2493630 RepID=UPI003A8BD240